MSAPIAGVPSSLVAPPATAGSPSTDTPSSQTPLSPVSASSTDTPATRTAPAPAPDSDAKDSPTALSAVQPSADLDSRQKAAMIETALRAGRSYKEIATAYQLSYTTIAEVAKHMDVFDASVLPRLMAQRAPEMLDTWALAAINGAKAGKHAAARDWLTHARVLDPVQAENTSNGAKVAIIIGMPGQPIETPSVQVIDTQQVTRDGDT